MDFATMFETWRRVVTQPGEPVFEEEKVNPNGSLQTALIWMVIAGVVAGIFGFFASLIGAGSAAALMSQMDLPPEVEAQMAPMLGAVGGAWSAMLAVIYVPIWFLISTFVLHLLAKMLGGQGEYERFAYMMSTFQAPLGIASSVVSIIPFLGGCVSFLIFIYTYVESYFALKVNYGLSNGKALTVILIPLALLILLGICFVGFIVAGIAALDSM